MHNYLIPHLGRIKLTALTPRHVQQLVVDLRADLAPATVIKIHGVLRNALAEAERMDLVTRNVAKAVRPGRLGRRERRALTVDEARRLMAELTQDRLSAAFTLAIAAGLRRGEVLGLRWHDVDLDAQTLRVAQTLQRSGGALRLVPPKTHRSERSLPLASLAVHALRQHRVQQAQEQLSVGDLWQQTDLVFTTQIGTPVEPRNLSHRFELARNKAGLPWVRLHDLRHAFATFLLDQGEELRTVMELLGHSTIRLTADTYAHVLPSRAIEAAKAIDRVLGQ